MSITNFEARRMTRKAKQTSHLDEVDHLTEIILLLEQTQYQIHVESSCRQQVDGVSWAPKEINPTKINRQGHC